jgi:purine-cytosine permease-like protein
VWTGVLLAILKVRKSSTEFRAWIIYLLAVAVLLLVAASGAEAAVRFRSVTMPLLAIAAAMGYFASESSSWPLGPYKKEVCEPTYSNLARGTGNNPSKE